ncbi:hypothetical protein NKDENANG_03575 [Candidatus Entotheonellaceae bacterium PAL068K]
MPCWWVTPERSCPSLGGHWCGYGESDQLATGLITDAGHAVRLAAALPMVTFPPTGWRNPDRAPQGQRHTPRRQNRCRPNRPSRSTPDLPDRVLPYLTALPPGDEKRCGMIQCARASRCNGVVPWRQKLKQASKPHLTNPQGCLKTSVWQPSSYDANVGPDIPAPANRARDPPAPLASGYHAVPPLPNN